MTIPTTHTDTVIDPAVRAQLQPPCEVIVLAYGCPVHGSHVRRCDQPAQWIVRTACGCATLEASLVCTGHLAELITQIAAVVCAGCHTAPCVVSKERLG